MITAAFYLSHWWFFNNGVESILWFLTLWQFLQVTFSQKTDVIQKYRTKKHTLNFEMGFFGLCWSFKLQKYSLVSKLMLYSHTKLEEDSRWKLEYWATSYIIFSDFSCRIWICNFQWFTGKIWRADSFRATWAKPFCLFWQ